MTDKEGYVQRSALATDLRIFSQLLQIPGAIWGYDTSKGVKAKVCVRLNDD
jgi:hypothetical protein